MLRPALLLLFFASGTAALVYELVWFHLVVLVVGASSLSIAALLASFMGGMAIGSALLPRLVPPTRHPLRVVAVLELCIAVFGLAMPFVLPYLKMGYVAAMGYGFEGVLMRAAVCSVALLPPTILIGATLPAISRWTEASPAGALTVGLLYMANIGGAAFGTLLAGFYLLRVHDTIVATVVAASINVVAAAAAWWLAARHTYSPSEVAVSEADEPGPIAVPGRARVVYLVAALSGMVALGAEVVWTRQLSLLFGASVYSFAVILAVFLGGLGLGSLTGSAMLRRGWAAIPALGWCQLLSVVAIGYGSRAIVDLLPGWQPTTTFLPDLRASPGLRFGYDAARTAVALLPATILWGASFPLAIAAVTGGRDAGRPVARINAVNTVGSLLGAVGFTLLAVPVIGSQHAQQGLVLLASVSALLAFLAMSGPWRRVSWAALAIATIAGVVVVPAVPGRLIAYGRSVHSWDTIKQILYLAEGATASVAVTEGIAGSRQFHISGKVEASDMDIDMRLERMLGHVPALVHPRPRSVLVVGVGAGVTAGTFVVHPEVERIVVVEIEPVVPASARAYFGVENHHVFDDPRVELIFDDARHYLQTTRETFDIITTDPIHPWVRGAATLYSLEYLELARQHLNPGGVFTQWVPLYETDARSVQSELATFVQAFPDTTFWNPDLLEEGYDLVAMGRLESTPIDEQAIEDRLSQSAELRASLDGVVLSSAASLLATYAGRGRDLAPWLVGAEINRERHMRLQYLAGMAANQDERYAIFQAIVDHRRYPADLLSVSATTEAWLRTWLPPSD
ncbi:MAG: fused MFS/spermidine synthase [Acidobacteriota bacterium]